MNDTATPLHDTAAALAWALAYITLHPAPDFHVGPLDDHQLQRWWVAPRNAVSNCYLHRFLRSDDDRGLHDHPWDNTSWVLSGEYLEHLENGDTITRHEGDVIHRIALTVHRIELVTGPAVSLFFTGPILRDWGFWCGPSDPLRPGCGTRFVPWWEFVSVHPGGNGVGRGCSE